MTEQKGIFDVRHHALLRPIDRLRIPLALTLVLTAFVATAPQVAQAGTPGPSFSKVFEPDMIGPGSTSTLTFTIVNVAKGTLDELAFTDVLPPGVVIAAPAAVDNECGGTVSAPDGAGTISLADGVLGLAETCKISVNVTGELDDGGNASWENTTGTLTSSAGSHGTASDTLDVTTSLPGFTKSFSPSVVEFGGRSTLTFTIDNSANATAQDTLDFTDAFPAGITVAGPANAATDCGTATIPPTLTATPGSSTVTLDADGTAGFPAIAAGATCTVDVDVIGGAVGSLENVSGNLLAEFVDAGKASSTLEVTGFKDLLALSKEFVDDPVAPGGTTTLEFTVSNKSRTDSATGITFTDTLDPLPGPLTGLTVGLPPVPDPPCGAGSAVAFAAGDLTLTGGNLAPESECTFSVDVIVPSTAPAGTYPNTTTAVSGDVGGSPATGNTAGDLLFIVPFPILEKEFTDDPVGAGGTATIEFTITNPEADSTMSDITFLDELTDGSGGFPPDLTSGFLPFPVSVTLPPDPDPPCGIGSSLALVSRGDSRQALELTGGSLAAAGGAGDSCTFSVTVDVPSDLAAGTYTNTTEEISAVLDDIAGTPVVTGPGASDDLTVVAAPRITKEFTDDPAVPGGTATLLFTLTNDDLDNAASAIAFTDDLGDALTDLTFTSLDSNDCGGTVAGIGSDLITVSGATLAADTTCTIAVTTTVPAGVGGTYMNDTSELTATVAGLATTSPGASDDLIVSGLLVDKAFTPDTVVPGQQTDITFTLDNVGAVDATSIAFTDDLTAILPGTPDISIVTLLPLTACGAGDVSASSGVLFFTGGSVAAGTACEFDVTVLVPTGAADGQYTNTTSPVTYMAGSSVTGPPAQADLTVDKTQLEITKEFTDDPVAPGDSVTLEFTITNLSTTATVDLIEFDDNLGAALSGLEATGATANTCGGMATSTFPTGLFEYEGASLTSGATCSIVLTVVVPDGPLPGSVFTNTTSQVLGEIGGLEVTGEPASDDLEIRTVEFTKSFDGPSTATGTAVLSFTITNLDSKNGVSGIAFTDDLDAVLSGLTATGLPADPCGAGSSIVGTSFLALTDGTVAAGGSCTFDVTVTVPAGATAGVYPNTTSELFSGGLPVAEPATADLTIESPPAFAKAFAPDTIAVDETSTLTFTIDNTASAVDATALDFTDTLPAGLLVATPSGAATTCTGGTLTAVAGSGTISYAGGTVAAGATCTVSVDVTASTAGAKINVSGDLTSSSGNSGTATDTLTASPAEADVSVTKTDGVTSAVPGGDPVTYTIVAANAGPSDDPAVAVADSFPSALTCTWTSVAAGGATGNTGAGSGDLAETLSMPAGSSVTYTASCDIAADTTGTLFNTVTATASVTDPTPGNNTATDSDTILTPEADVSITKTDGVTSAVPGETLTYTIVVSSAGPSTAPVVDVTDTFPTALTCAWTSAAAGGATGNTASGSGNLDETLTMPAGSSVTYTASCDIDPAATGTLSNTASATVSDALPLIERPAAVGVVDPDTGNNSATDETTLTPEADISITKTDGRTAAVAGQDTIVYTIVVSNAGPSTDPAVKVTDNFPATLTCVWTSTPTGISGNSAAGSGDIAETLLMPPGATVTYTASCIASPTAAGNLTNVARAKGSVTDPNPSNSTATDNNTQLSPLAPATEIPATGGDAWSVVRTAVLTALLGAGLVLFAHRSRRRANAR